MPTKATTMPGGAPLKGKAKKKAPCKYGARVDGRCPPKPKAAKKPAAKKAAKGKPPCKYGPRDADGYCPKKPKAGTLTRTSSGEIAIAQKRGRPKTVKTVVTKAAEQAVGREVDKLTRKAAKSNIGEKVKKAAGVAASALAKLNPLALAAGAAITGAVLGTKQVQAGANRMRADTEKRLKRKLTAAEWKLLEPQYKDFVRNSFAAAAKKASGRG